VLLELAQAVLVLRQARRAAPQLWRTAGILVLVLWELPPLLLGFYKSLGLIGKV
jgi:hypothetical protein